MQTVLVTGCAGFIGSNLAQKLLQNGFRVIGVDNFDPLYSRIIKEKNLQLLASPFFQFLELDLSKEDAYVQLPLGIDCVVHLAAKGGVLPSLQAPLEYIQNNIGSTALLLEWMKKWNCKKLVFASSSSVYGNNKKTPFVESDPVNEPISPYAFTKRACELMNYNYHHNFGFSILNLRFFTVYGPAQRPDLAIHKFFDCIKTGTPITMYGDGSTSRDYTYIDDIVEGVMGAIQYVTNTPECFEIINLGNQSPITLKSLIELVFLISETQPNIIIKPKQVGDVEQTFASIDKAKALLGYSPKTTLRDGLLLFKHWHDKHVSPSQQ